MALANPSAKRLPVAGRSALAAVATAALLLVAARWRGHLLAWNFEDLAVYRHGASSLFAGRSMYAHTSALPFTYPPFAALCTAPLLPIGAAAADVLVTIASLAAYVYVVRTCARRLALSRPVTDVMLIAGLAFEPVLRDLMLGQVNLLLAALVVHDVLRAKDARRGVLIGIAGGIKLIPFAFVILFLIRRDWKAVRRACLAFGATVLLGAIAAPADSARYWLHLRTLARTTGSQMFVDNQSLNGVLSRLFAHPSNALALCVSAAALVLAAAAARRQIQGGNDVAALVCVAVGAELASPISWTHHWIWCVPLVLVLLGDGYRRAAVTVAAICYLSPNWFPRSGHDLEIHQPWWDKVLFASFTLVGFAFLVSQFARSNPVARSPSWR